MHNKNGYIVRKSVWSDGKWREGDPVTTYLDDEAILFERFTAPARDHLIRVHTKFSLDGEGICLHTPIDENTRQRETWFLAEPWVINAFQIFATLAYKCISSETKQSIESPVEWKEHVEDWAVFEGSRRQLTYFEAIAAILQFDGPEGCIETSSLDTARTVIDVFKNPRKRLSHPCPPKLPDLKLAK